MVNAPTPEKSRHLPHCGFCRLVLAAEHDQIEYAPATFAHVSCVSNPRPSDHKKWIAFENAYGPRM